MIAVDVESHSRLFNTLTALVQFDDYQIAFDAMSIEFSKFEETEMVSCHRFITTNVLIILSRRLRLPLFPFYLYVLRIYWFSSYY